MDLITRYSPGLTTSGKWSWSKMQEFDLYSMWLSEDDVVNSIFEDTISAMGSVDAAAKFLRYRPEKLRMGKYTTFYYAQESANAALLKHEHRFVNLIKTHVKPSELDTEPVVRFVPEVEYEVVMGEDEEDEEDQEDLHENEDDKNQLPSDIIEVEGEVSSQLSPIPDECDLMTIQEFIDSVKDGLFNDDDGHGRYANGLLMSPEMIYPSDVVKGVVLEGWTHIAWFNK